MAGIEVNTKMGEIQRLGNTTKSASNLAKTFNFENENFLVGFYGTKLDWQINSLGVIYVDPFCLPAVVPINPVDPISEKN